jgi:hypothetical protein
VFCDTQQIQRLGRWLYDAMHQSYLKFFKADGLLAAGWWPNAAKQDFETFFEERFCEKVPLVA